MAGRCDILRRGDQPLIMLAATHLQEREREVAQAQALREARGTGVPHWQRLPATVLHALGGRLRLLIETPLLDAAPDAPGEG
jgi:hypothetical protein